MIRRPPAPRMNEDLRAIEIRMEPRRGVVVDGSANIWVTGHTLSQNFSVSAVK